MKKTWALAALAGLAVAAGGASAQVFSASPGTTITTTANVTYTNAITVAGGPVAISDVNAIIRITHTWDSDLNIILQGPGALGYINLSTGNGGSGDNYVTTRFDDLATVAITAGAAPFNNNFRPEGTINGWTGAAFVGTNHTTLAGFNGADSNGAWTMYVRDQASGDGGNWAYWSLEFNGAVDPNGPPPLGSPTNPTGVGSLNPTTVFAGGAPTNMRVTVTPGTFPNSTWGNPGTGVTINGTAIGTGTITLFDDGLHNDGASGDNIWGADVSVPGATPGGTYTLPFAILDNQGRAGSGNMPVLTVVGPPPVCPPGSQPSSFTNIDSIDPVNDTTPGNVFFSLGWTPGDIIDKIHISGRLQEINTGTFASEARFRVHFTDSTFVDLQPFTTGGFTGVIDVTNFVSGAINRPVSDIANIQAFDSFDDTVDGVDARWLNLCFSYDALLLPTNPTGVGSATPNSGQVGNTTNLNVIVTNGQNPVSTFANVGSGVSVDASQIDAGTVTLFDDGLHADGGAGDNNWGSGPVTVGALATPGAKTLPFTITDDQARSGSGNIAFTVVPPPPSCPPGSEPASFTNLISFGPQGNAGNSTVLTGFASTSVVNKLHFSGRQDCDASTGSFSSESRIRVNFSDSTFQVFQPIPAGSGTDLFDVVDAVMTLTTPRPANEIVSVETWDSFDDPGQDAVWLNFCVAWESAPSNPTGSGTHGTPASCFGFANGDSVALTVNVTPGLNPTSTFANVGSGVVVDASSIGGGSVTLTDLGGNVWGGSATVTGAAGGTYSLPFTITDDQARVGNGSITGVVVAPDFTGMLPASAPDFPGGTVAGLLPSGALMWRIEVCDPSSFSASTVDAGTTADTQLFLFNAAGVGVSFSDDTGTAASTITNANVFCPGIYYLALSGYDYDAVDSTCQALWNDTPFGTERAPDGPGAANAIAGWQGTNSNGGEPFVLNVTGAGAPGSCGGGCITDLNTDGASDQGDVDCMIALVAGDPSCLTNTCFDADFNGDGNVDQGDVDALIDVIAGGACP